MGKLLCQGNMLVTLFHGSRGGVGSSTRPVISAHMDKAEGGYRRSQSFNGVEFIKNCEWIQAVNSK